MSDREKLIELLDENFGYVEEQSAEKLADRLIAAGVVFQRYGTWVDTLVRDWRCTSCGKKTRFDGYVYDDKPNYCPNCGSKMIEK